MPMISHIDFRTKHSRPSAGRSPLILLVTHCSSAHSVKCVSLLAPLKMLTLDPESSRVLSHRLESPASPPILAIFTYSAEKLSQIPPSPECHSGHHLISFSTHSTIWLLSVPVLRFTESLQPLYGIINSVIGFPACSFCSHESHTPNLDKQAVVNLFNVSHLEV